MKAIHNITEAGDIIPLTVVTLSKIGKMKAIHNVKGLGLNARKTVVTLSKIGKMKALHNFLHGKCADGILL